MIATWVGSAVGGSAFVITEIKSSSLWSLQITSCGRADVVSPTLASEPNNAANGVLLIPLW